MPTNLDDLNKLRGMMGKDPLTELPVEATENKVEDTTITTTNTEAENKIPVIESKVEEKVPEAKKEVIEEKKVTAPKAELTQEEVLEFLKKKGIDVSSLDEIAPKKETAEQIAERRENAKLAYAFSKGLITQKQFQSYSADSADLTNLVYRQYLQEQRKADPSLSDSDIHDEFHAKYGLDADADSRAFKRGQREINVLGKEILKDTYKEIFSVDETYSKYESEENARIAEERKILTETPKYKAHIDELFSKDLTKFSVKLGEDTYDLEVPADILAQTKSELLKLETAVTNIKSGYDNNTMTEIAQMMVLKSSYPKLLQDAFDKGRLKTQAGVKGIVPNKDAHVEQTAITQKQSELRGKLGFVAQGAN